MSAKIILVFCAQALFVQSALSQCTSRAGIAAPYGLGAPYDLAAPYGLAAPYDLAAPCGLAASYDFGAPYGLAAPYGIAAPAVDYTPTSGGLLPVSSASLIAPVGISVASENIYEGPLAVAGQLPFVGTVGLEGVLPTAGRGAVNHACGNGINAMISEGIGYAPGYAGAAIAPAAAIASYDGIAPGLGYRAGFAGRGCGCGF